MKYPDVEDIEILHAELIEVTGGAHGIRDRGLLESAVSQPSSSFGGVELYETIADKATALCFSMAMNHPFIDGNKRIAHGAAFMLLRMNG
jgi:death-on-curing protein